MKLKVLVILFVVSMLFSCSKNSKKTTWLVSPNEVGSTSDDPQASLQIKEDGQKDWAFFFDKIEGFDYEEGLYYKIKVETAEIEAPSEDGPTLRYKLLEILEKSKIPLNLDYGSWLVTRIKDTDRFGRNPFIKIDLSKKLINGNTSCNRFTAKIVVDDDNIAISGLSSTNRMCKDFETETLFLEAVEDVSTYTLNEGKLQLLDRNDRLLIECTYLKSE